MTNKIDKILSDEQIKKLESVKDKALKDKILKDVENKSNKDILK